MRRTQAGVQRGVHPAVSTLSRGPVVPLRHRSRTRSLRDREPVRRSVLEFRVDPMERERERWTRPRGVLRFLIYSGAVEEAVDTTVGPAMLESCFNINNGQWLPKFIRLLVLNWPKFACSVCGWDFHDQLKMCKKPL